MGRAIEGGGSLRPVAHALMEAVRDSEVLESASLRPFRAALGRVLPGIAAEEANRLPLLIRRLYSVRACCGCCDQSDGSGTLLVLEDLHWADPDTVALLDYLGGTLKHLAHHRGRHRTRGLARCSGGGGFGPDTGCDPCPFGPDQLRRCHGHGRAVAT